MEPKGPGAAGVGEGDVGVGQVKSVATSVGIGAEKVDLDLQIGEVVVIDGLLLAPDLNGLVGKVPGFDAASARYMIELENGKGNRRIKRCNLLTEEDLDDAEGVENDDSCVSGIVCRYEINIGRASAGSQGENLSAAHARR